MKFELALETGPKHRKTMVHVLSLPGVTTMGPTTAEAVESTHLAIRERLDFLRGHGESASNAEPMDLVVTEEDTTSGWLGFGIAFFDWDARPIESEELRRQVQWAEWAREALIEAARAQPGGLRSGPPGKGRQVAEILAHVAGAERAYLNSVVGPVSGLNDAIKAIENNPGDPWQALSRARAILVERILALTAVERTVVVERGKERRTARRMLRRMLEHELEHVLELRARLRS